MLSNYFLLVAILSFCDNVVPSSPSNPQCSTGAAKSHVFEVNIRSERNASGEWITKLEGRKESENRTDNLAMDFKHQVTECGEKQSFHFVGLFGETPIEVQERLTFHPKCGKNVAITNKGRTLEKFNGENNVFGVALTNRHLKLNELFEVTIDEKLSGKFNHYIGIGITTTSPEEAVIPDHINNLRSGTWAYYHKDVYNNGKLTHAGRKNNLDHLKVGDRVGLMINDSRTLLLYINGKAEPVASNVPYPAYGAFECYGDPIKVTLTG